jgi:phosphoribosyl-ATP pyrophosphohydrolase
LLFHMMVGLSFQNITMEDIYSELERRIGKKKTDYTLDE